MTDKIYIILPVHNRREITQCFIECLKAQTYQNYHLILVDDGSTDGTEEMVRSNVRSLTVIKGKGNWWWAGGLQQGINWLKHNDVQASDIVLMVNDDVTFDNFFLEKAIEILKYKQNCLLHAEAFGKKSGHLLLSGVQADLRTLTFRQTSVPHEINCLSTMGLFMKFSDLIKIGDFYPKVLPHYFSDYEFTIRAGKKGIELCVDSALKVLLNEQSTGFVNYNVNMGFQQFIKLYFSNKSVNNPIHYTVFAILVCPKLWAPLNILKIWKSAMTIIFQKVGYSVSLVKKSIN